MKFMKALHKTKTVDAVPFDVTDVASGESIRTAIDGASINTMIAVGNAGNACHSRGRLGPYRLRSAIPAGLSRRWVPVMLFCDIETFK